MNQTFKWWDDKIIYYVTLVMIHHWSGRISGGGTGNRYGHLTGNGGRRLRVFITFHVHVNLIIEVVSVVGRRKTRILLTIHNNDNLDYDVDIDVEGDDNSNFSLSIVDKVTIAVASVSTGILHL